MIIDIEGIDGTGKSTLAKKLIEQLPGFLYTKEPGSPLINANKTLREIALHYKSLSAFNRELVFLTDASIHREFLERNKDLYFIRDRGYWSHVAYQEGLLEEGTLSPGEYIALKKMMPDLLAAPTAVIYLRGDLELKEERIKSRGEAKDLIESKQKLFFETVIDTYDELMGKKNVLTLDARVNLDHNVEESVRFIKEVMNNDVRTDTFKNITSTK